MKSPELRPAAAALALALTLPALAGATPPLRIGVTLAPYYSWVARLTRGVPVELVSLLPPGADVHSYQPGPADVARIAGLDLLVANGIGHDPGWVEVVRANARPGLVEVDLHAGVPLLPYAVGGGHSHGGDGAAAAARPVNPHTFLSLTTAIQQLHNLQRALAAVLPGHARTLRENTRAYVREIRGLLARTTTALADAKTLSVATIHDGYVYLLQELGVRVVEVLQPRHGIEPSASELAATMARIRATGVEVVFSELDFPERYLTLIREGTGARVVPLTHMRLGMPTEDGFLAAMEANCRAVVSALVGAGG